MSASATFRLSRKAASLQEIKRATQEQRAKGKTTVTHTKIDSPLAKYTAEGLMCILCKSIVRSENVWKVHVNTKAHKEKVESAKQLTNGLQQQTASKKRPVAEVPSTTVVPEKKAKASDNEEVIPKRTTLKDSLPSNFFEATLEKTSIRKDLVNIKRVTGDKDSGEASKKVAHQEEAEVLPEGFFDDPMKDAKIRNLEYKDAQEEEWERFQQEIKEAASFSNAIIAEDQEEATAERQIEEIDEQIRKWNRVLEIEKKKEDISSRFKEKITRMAVDKDSGSESSSDEEADNLDDFLDWRSKGLKK